MRRVKSSRKRADPPRNNSGPAASTETNGSTRHSVNSQTLTYPPSMISSPCATFSTASTPKTRQADGTQAIEPADEETKHGVLQQDGHWKSADAFPRYASMTSGRANTSSGAPCTTFWP